MTDRLEFHDLIESDVIADKARILEAKSLARRLGTSLSDGREAERATRLMYDAYLNLQAGLIAGDEDLIKKCRQDCYHVLAEYDGRAGMPLAEH